MPQGPFASGFSPTSTNQLMELTAALEALRRIPSSRVRVHTDSKYLTDGFNKGWVRNWERNGWLTAARKPVKHRDVWEALQAEVVWREVDFHWVKGHSSEPGCELNDEADRLAVEAARSQSGRTGECCPLQLHSRYAEDP